jgi:GNAT superfamily N-acetyltransferase
MPDDVAGQMVDDLAARVGAIETAFVTHWSNFGRWPGASLHDETGVLWFETPIAHLPYNAVIRTAIPAEIEADKVIGRVAAGFRQRSVPFLWVQRPSDRPTDRGRRLPAHGLDLVEQAMGMDLGLDAWQPEPITTEARLVEVLDDPALRDYGQLIRTYWSVPDGSRELIERLNRYWGPGPRNPGLRLVAYLGQEPVGKLFMNLLELPSRVAIYGVAVLPSARGHGIATALMSEALSRAKTLGAARALLHSSAMARPLYERMGFTERCSFNVYATGPLFGTHHH